MGENDPGRAIWFPEMFYGFAWEKPTPSVPKFVDMSPIDYATLKTKFPSRVEEETKIIILLKFDPTTQKYVVWEGWG